MARHTTYRIGGPARFYVQVDSLRSLKDLVFACRKANDSWVVVGRGSNLLVSDEGYMGVVIKLGRDFRKVRFDEETHRFCVGAGAPLSAVVQKAFHQSLGGFEFAVGTPGTVGGALRMNAGTRKDWIGQRVVSVTMLSPEGELVKVRGTDVEWGYRKSSLPADHVILECELSVEPADPYFIRAKMEAQRKRRAATQPQDAASCGSVFKNPEGASAAQLIESAGMKGFSVGGAQVSTVHANFIVNKGSATARDVLGVMEQVQTKVYETYGIELQPEVRFLGFA